MDIGRRKARFFVSISIDDDTSVSLYPREQEGRTGSGIGAELGYHVPFCITRFQVYYQPTLRENLYVIKSTKIYYDNDTTYLYHGRSGLDGACPVW